jgi:hypothetical protein
MRRSGLAVVLTLSLTLAPLAAGAQTVGKVYRLALPARRCNALHSHDAQIRVRADSIDTFHNCTGALVVFPEA